MKKSIRVLAVTVVGGLALAACGSNNDSATSSASSAASAATSAAASVGSEASSAASSAASEAGSAASSAADAASSAASSAGSDAGSSEAGSATAGGGAGAGTQLPATTISILAPSYADSSQADWQKIIDAFKKVQPNVTVKLQIEAWDGFTDKVQARIQGGDMPDILNDNNYAQSAKAGILYPIDEVMSPETIKLIEPALLKNGMGSDGKQWAAPDIATSRLLAYNTELFSKAGITAAPKTWDEMLADAKKLGTGGVSGYGMPLGKEEAQSESTVWVWGAGGDWAVDGKLVANNPAAVEGFTEMKKFIDEKATQPNPGASNRQDVADLFNQGKVAMMVSHPGLLATTRDKFKNIKYAVAPIPSKDGKGVAYGVTDFILAFNNKDEARKAATKAFLDFFYQPDNYTAWYKGTGLLPVTSTGITDAAANDKDNAPFIEALKTVRFTPSGDPQWTALQNALQTSAGQISGQDPKALLDTIQQQMEATG